MCSYGYVVVCHMSICLFKRCLPVCKTHTHILRLSCTTASCKHTYLSAQKIMCTDGPVWPEHTWGYISTKREYHLRYVCTHTYTSVYFFLWAEACMNPMYVWIESRMYIDQGLYVHIDVYACAHFFRSFSVAATFGKWTFWRCEEELWLLHCYFYVTLCMHWRMCVACGSPGSLLLM